MRTVALCLGALAVALVLALGREGSSGTAPGERAAGGDPPPVRPAPPARYRAPRDAIRVSGASGLHAALHRHRRRAIVLASGVYESERPFLNQNGHRLYAARVGGAVSAPG